MATKKSLKEIETLVIEALAKASTISNGIQKTLQILGKKLNWDIGIFWKVETEFKKIYRAQVIPLGHVNPLVFLEQLPRLPILNKTGFHIDVWKRRKPKQITNLKRNALAKKYKGLIDIGISSVVVFPVCTNGTVIGVTEFFSRKPIKLNSEMIDGLQSIIYHLGHFIQRKETEIALEESQTQLKLAIQAARMGHWKWDIHTNKVWWSENMEQIFGLTIGAFRGDFKAFIELVHPEDQDLVKRSLFIAIEKKSDYNIEFRAITPKMITLWINARGQAFYADNGQAKAMTGVAIDITQRKFDEDRLQANYDEMEKRVQERTLELSHINEALQEEILERKNVEREILEISQKEQRRFGSQLHDGICQDLTGLLMLTRVLEKKMEQKKISEAQELKKISALLLQNINQARNMARGLYPVELEGTSLMSSLQELSVQAQSFMNVNCKFKCPSLILIEDNNIATHLYRIAQESISNAVKHGTAKNILISLTKKGNKVTLVVQDDGSGLMLNIQNPKGIGLQIMKYRARMIDATLKIESNKPCGVSLTCTFKAPNLAKKSSTNKTFSSQERLI